MCKQTVYVKPTSRGVRVWLEGPRLAEHGFAVGSRYSRALVNGVITMTLDSEGKLKVAGKGDRPIIDYSAKSIEGLSTNQSLTAIFTDGRVVIS